MLFTQNTRIFWGRALILSPLCLELLLLFDFLSSLQYIRSMISTEYGLLTLGSLFDFHLPSLLKVEHGMCSKNCELLVACFAAH
jgi:hypothetical protein